MRNIAENRLSLEKFGGAPSLYAGGSMRGLGVEKLKSIAGQVSAGLEEYPNTMIQYSQRELLQSIYGKRAACVMDSQGRIAAFAQYWPYKIDDTGDGYLRGREVFEIGSWLSFSNGQERGWGMKVFEACLAVGTMQHPDARFISIIEKGNGRAANLLEAMNWEKKAEKNSQQVKDAYNNPARMAIYELKGKNESQNTT